MSDHKTALAIVPFGPEDRDWARELLRRRWGSNLVASRGRLHDASHLPGFVLRRREKGLGLVTYRIEAPACEIVSLDSLVPNRGIGSALVEAVRQTAISDGCTHLWLITTNDNLAAMRFYQKRGFLLWQVHRNGVAALRELKPEIPLVAESGIPVRDEVEFRMPLPPANRA